MYTCPTNGGGGHSVGMGIDLGLSTYINSANLNDQTDGNRANLAIPGTGWSVANAIAWSNLLNSGANNAVQSSNDQGGALRNFLSLYALTQRDALAANGTYEDISLVNGEAVRAALFGSGDQTASGLFQNVWIGGRSTPRTPQKPANT